MTGLAWISHLWLSLAVGPAASSSIAQSLVVEFPSNGRVIVQATEETGKFPEMLFIAEKSGTVLLRRTIRDENRWLVPVKDGLVPPNLRFRVIRSSGFESPLIMSVGIYHGGSDNAFYLTVFGEVEGRLRCLIDRPIFANIQGGYYLGHLNDKLGYGLVTWTFIWGNDVDEFHYGKHHYEAKIYKLRGPTLARVLRRVSRKKIQWRRLWIIARNRNKRSRSTMGNSGDKGQLRLSFDERCDQLAVVE